MGSGLGCFMGVYHGDRIRSMILGGATVGMDLPTTLLLNAGNLLKEPHALHVAVPFFRVDYDASEATMPEPWHFVREAHKAGRKGIPEMVSTPDAVSLHQLEFQQPVLLETPNCLFQGTRITCF
jgi:hypothetical protein